MQSNHYNQQQKIRCHVILSFAKFFRSLEMILMISPSSHISNDLVVFRLSHRDRKSLENSTRPPSCWLKFLAQHTLNSFAHSTNVSFYSLPLKNKFKIQQKKLQNLRFCLYPLQLPVLLIEVEKKRWSKMSNWKSATYNNRKTFTRQNKCVQFFKVSNSLCFPKKFWL